MHLALAGVESCTETGCRVRFLEEHNDAVDLPYSALMRRHGIRARPGQVVAVDRGAQAPEILWRFGVHTVERLDGDEAVLAGRSFRLRDERPAEERGQAIRAGDTVVVRAGDDASELAVYDIAVAGQPLHPERLRADFPRIVETYRGSAIS